MGFQKKSLNYQSNGSDAPAAIFMRLTKSALFCGCYEHLIANGWKVIFTNKNYPQGKWFDPLSGGGKQFSAAVKLQAYRESKESCSTSLTIQQRLPI